MKNEYTLNRIEGFNPYDHIEAAKDRRGNIITRNDGRPLEYLSTAAKTLWFRMVYPKGALITEQLETQEKEFGEIVSFRATVIADNDTLLAEWTHQETVWDIAEKDGIVAKVQTIALGKALSRAGFGCEIELCLGAVSEGETPEEPKEVPAEAPKKKRGRPKKEEAPAPENLEDEVSSLMAEVENSIAQETEAIPSESKDEDDTSAKIDKYLDMELTLTEDPNVNVPIKLKTIEGLKLSEVLVNHKGLGELVKTRPNIRKALSKECADALIFIEEHKM